MFLLPDLRELQGMPSKVIHEHLSVPTKDQARIAEHGIVGLRPTNGDFQAQNEWHAELAQAIKTLSALQIVDLGLFDDE